MLLSLVENLNRLSRGSGSRPLAKPLQAYPGCAGSCCAAGPRFADDYQCPVPGLLRPPERPPGLGSFLFFALPRHLVLSPPVRAHYPLKGCQLVTSWHQLIRREMIFKVPVGGLLDGLSPCRCVLLRWVNTIKLVQVLATISNN
jgi:hypothetical protein